MTKNKKRFVAAALILTILLILYLYLRDGDSNEEYVTARVVRESISEVVKASGTLNALVTVQVGSQVTGRIKTLNADFNSKVKKGQIIAQIDPDPFQAKVEREKASLVAAKASVSTARANLGKAEVDLKEAQRQLKRVEELLKKGVVSESEGDIARARYDSDSAELKAQEASYENALAKVEQAKASLKSAESDLSHATIISPVDGIVISRDVDVGQTVSANLQAPTLFVIAEDLTNMQLDASVVEADIGHVSAGQEVTFTVDAYIERKFEGKVTQVRNAPVIVQNVVTYDVILGVENSDLRLKPGMTANVSILTAFVDKALKVPSAALYFRPNFIKENQNPGAQVKNKGRSGYSPYNVWVLPEEGEPTQVSVDIGISDGDFTEVTGGRLKEGDEVITGVKSGKGVSSQRRRGRFRF